MTADEEQIRGLMATWLTATAAGDIETVLGLMTDDVVFLVAGREPMHKAEFEVLSRGSAGSAPPRIRSQVDIQEVQVAGDLAFAWTRLSVSVTPPGAAAPMQRAGHTLSVFRRIAGRWLLARDANLLVPVQPERP